MDPRPAGPTRWGFFSLSSEERRVAIRKSAFVCFRSAGYHNTTIDDICGQAGISKGSFYWYYGSKQEIFIEILETWRKEVVDELYTQFQTALTHEDYVAAITQAVTRETHRGRSIVPLWLEFSAQSLHDPVVKVALSQFYQRIRWAIAELLRPVLGARLTDTELQAVAATIFGAYSGLMIQDLCDPDDATARESVRHFMSALRVWLKHETHSEPSVLEGIHLTPVSVPPTGDGDTPVAPQATPDADETSKDAV